MTHEQLFYSVVAMNALFASLAWCAAKPNRASILSVVIFAVVWPLADKALEGHVLLPIGKHHGITESDLLSVFAVVVAGIQMLRLARKRTQNRQTSAKPQEEQHWAASPLRASAAPAGRPPSR
jgi:hypothetical protein